MKHNDHLCLLHSLEHYQIDALHLIRWDVLHVSAELRARNRTDSRQSAAPVVCQMKGNHTERL